ncbi:hypothetical protein [Virgisporangium aurantiacum]|uniref:Peptidase M4 n=1 Tax=Virgisporangium aurantiacum TaxID=175570 RepID=A0A8J3YY33_9ACTN|nr:hypothetical protein [Virgisporangium aurantiacum]GIJ53804.1 hypothetical protein Vau01_013200 [Virgisporangium aurantiacum]
MTTPAVAEAALTRYPEPDRRPLQVFAFDPMVARLSGQETTTISVPYEPLRPGPSGELIQVIDYDSATGCYYEPVDLDDPRVLLLDGLHPSERDPRFHQQMVYAVTSALLENFERALGRRFRWRGDKRLRAFPHAFRGRNAMFDPDMDGTLQFGYFRADEKNPGRNLPGQTVFTCLSHDIIVHEATHALVHRLRERYKEPTNLDVYAFHEGFADAVALFQHFTLPDIVDRYIQQNRTDLTTNTPLVELAEQFGEGSGMGQALRSAIGQPPDPALINRTFEPHRRGSILVAAIFDGFFTAYQTAIADLLRIATAGSGVLPKGALHPDLVRRVSAEARTAAQRILTMCIRSFQYLPPVDVTFSDFLRSIVTADRDLYPSDEDGLRAALIEGFRRRGIYPSAVSSLADEALSWPDAADLGLPPIDRDVINALVLDTAVGFRERRGEAQATTTRPVFDPAWAAAKLHQYALANLKKLGLAGPGKIKVDGFHAAFRHGANGQLRVDVAVRYLHSAPVDVQQKFSSALGGVPLRGGATVVADATGRVRHVITKAVPTDPTATDATDAGVARLVATRQWVAQFDGHDLLVPWVETGSRVTQSLNFARIDSAV